MAVAGVIAFHAGFGWAVGGYLGVSAFFTLSGFLITSLLLAEHGRTGRVDLRAFWARRFRRLLPAALLTLAAVTVLAAVAATPDQLAALRADVLAALAYAANWRFALAGQDYGDLFGAPSPVLHFWSLAIEEQFYLVFPLLVAGAVAVSRRPRRLLTAGLVALVAVSVAAGIALHEPGQSTAAAYYGTVTRAPELLVGALLAVVLGRPRSLTTPARRMAVGVVGTVAMAVMLWSWTTVEVATSGLYRGGFLVHGIATAAVIAAAMQPGPVRSLLSLPPLRWLGRVSYGAYLYHWPIFMWLTPDRVGLRGLPLTTLHVALTLALAAVSLRAVEAPIRQGRTLRGWRPLVAAPVAALVVVVGAVVVTADPPRSTNDFSTDGLEAALAATGRRTPPPPPPEVPRVAVFGDSTSLRTNFALAGWGMLNGRIAVVAGASRVGCGLGRGGAFDYGGSRREIPPECGTWPEEWRAVVAAHDLDAAIIQIGPWDVTDRRLAGDDVWRHPGDPVYDAFLKSEMLAAVDVLSSSGAKVIWLTSPLIDLGRSDVPPPAQPYPASDPARMRRLNELVAEVAAERRGIVEVIDVAAHLRSLPGGELDPRLRPDGVHLTEEASKELVEWLGPRIIEAAQDASITS